jgi:hypothetical protein
MRWAGGEQLYCAGTTQGKDTTIYGDGKQTPQLLLMLMISLMPWLK